MVSGATCSLSGVWGSSATDVFAVGEGGTILHYNGSSWTPMASVTTADYLDLSGVWGISGTDVFAVGDGYDPVLGTITILHYDGSAWSPVDSGTINPLSGIWGISGTDVFAVGDGGTILHYAGSTSTTTVPLTTTTVPSPLITLSSFIATPKSSKVLLQWSTKAEVDNTGFNIYRSESEYDGYRKINGSLITAKGSITQGASYEFIDTDVQNRKTYYHKLEDMDLNGIATMHGPVSATPRWILGIFEK
jgi:hypothetical protein